MTANLELLDRNHPSAVWWEPDAVWRRTPAAPVCGLLPGSFNPLHSGHLQLRATAAGLLEGSVAFELSSVNADKPPLTRREIERRCRQFVTEAIDSVAVAVTNAPTFIEKSVLFPNVTFVVGADTAMRIVDPRFYQDDLTLVDVGLAKIADQGCRFLVAARCWDGRLLTLDDVPIPAQHRKLFEAIPPSKFRLDVSSTELRLPD